MSSSDDLIVELQARIAALESEIALLKGVKKKSGRPEHPRKQEIIQLLNNGEKREVISAITGASLQTIWRTSKELKSRNAKE